MRDVMMSIAMAREKKGRPWTPNIKIDRKRALNFAVDIARSFAYLHSRSPPVIHRDIKPANFLVDRAYKAGGGVYSHAYLFARLLS